MPDYRRPTRRRRAALSSIPLLFALLVALLPTQPPVALADHQPDPVDVTVAGSFQNEAGCSGDWQPDCGATRLIHDAAAGMWQGSFALPAGSYEAKVAINNGWDENYGQGGAQNGANIPFTVPAGGAPASFSYNPNTHVLTITVATSGSQPDNNVEWDGLRHDSRDLLYRTPGGAVPAGTPVTIRFRTFRDDVTAVTLRVYDLDANGQRLVPMELAARDVDCYQAGLEDETCDFWAATVDYATPNNIWYRFIVDDGTDRDFYGDNTAALDGGLGRVTDDPVDQSYALMFYDPAFAAPDWAPEAVIYQIFPDRFRNGDKQNDPRTGDARYDDPVVFLPWSTLPEGYCRNYADGDANCPWRFDDTPPETSPTKEQPRGRDYFGGDLKGVTKKLGYLKELGVNAIYFNPIFYAKSNHRYDTADYFQIDPYLGDLKDFEKLVKEAKKAGIRIILDGVYNHMSSDSDRFDRYRRYDTLGACESAASPYRAWFNFRAPAGAEPAPCAASTPGGDDTYYNGWFGFDSIPEIKKTNPEVQDYFLGNPNSVSRYWLREGAAGWRMDVMGDASFPNGYWEAFRDIVKQTDPEALIIGELWQKDSTLLRYLRGDRADTTMNYRLRDAVIGLLTPGSFDSKGFADSGRPIAPSEFANRLLSIKEDYADASFGSLMNLLDSHDTERLLWTLTPGAETRAEKEFDADNLANGKLRMRLASLIQLTMPGAPTIYYGDEVGVTGDDDPDDRRTYPWPDRGGRPDTAMLDHYRSLTRLRQALPALTGGDFSVLLADDAVDTVAYGRKIGSQAALVAINRGAAERTIEIPLAGYLPNGSTMRTRYGVNVDAGVVTVADGAARVTLPAMSGVLLVAENIDLTPPAAPTNARVTSEGDGRVEIAWDAVAGAVGYNVYRSPLNGGGWVALNAEPLAATGFVDTGLRNAQSYYYVVRALDPAGNESAASNEISALPRYVVGFAHLQWPPTLEHTISTTDRTGDVYGQVWIDGVTNQGGPTASLRAELGFGPDGSDPAGNAAWTWVAATFNGDVGNNDEWKASLLPEVVGQFDYAYRYSATNGRDWIYADLDGAGNGYSPDQAGSLTVLGSGDTAAPGAPDGLRVVSASPAGIALEWNVVNDPSLHGYEVRRADTAGGPYTTLALVTAGTGFVDTTVAEGQTYFYVVRAVDTSFNRSAPSSAVEATAALRTVTVIFNVTVPAGTDASGRTVHIAGFLDRLDGGLPQWNPGGVALQRVSDTLWRIALTGKETTQIEYKYALGAWDFVEKDGACGEIGNRQLTLSFGGDGTQIVNDTVGNWRNVAPCGN